MTRLWKPKPNPRFDSGVKSVQPKFKRGRYTVPANSWPGGALLQAPITEAGPCVPGRLSCGIPQCIFPCGPIFLIDAGTTRAKFHVFTFAHRDGTKLPTAVFLRCVVEGEPA